MAQTKAYETLANMNTNTAKHATWLVRVLDTKVIKYKFETRGAKKEEVHATKFQCILVSNDTKSYMHGAVNFTFQDRQAAQKAENKFKEGSVWKIDKPIFDTKARTEYNSCPVKTVVLLDTSKVKTVLPTSSADLAYPAKYIEVPLKLDSLLQVLTTMKMKSPGSARVSVGSGSAKPSLPSKCIDFAGKLLHIGEQKNVEKAGRMMKAAAASFVDETGVKIEGLCLSVCLFVCLSVCLSVCSCEF
jgi:hypothetical protein